jgi:hypothetical protein
MTWRKEGEQNLTLMHERFHTTALPERDTLPYACVPEHCSCRPFDSIMEL